MIADPINMAGIAAKVGDAVKSWPLWSWVAVALGLTALALAPPCMVKNRTDEPLHLLKAKLIRPKISGEELPGLVTIQAPDSNMHGTAYVSGYNIPAGHTLPASATILHRGVPKQRSGTMTATIEFHDADTNRVRMPIVLNMASPPGPVRSDLRARFGLRG